MDRHAQPALEGRLRTPAGERRTDVERIGRTPESDPEPASNRLLTAPGPPPSCRRIL